MSLTEGLLIVAILDGPVLGFIYFLWRGMQAQEKVWKK